MCIVKGTAMTHRLRRLTLTQWTCTHRSSPNWFCR